MIGNEGRDLARALDPQRTGTGAIKKGACEAREGGFNGLDLGSALANRLVRGTGSMARRPLGS